MNKRKIPAALLLIPVILAAVFLYNGNAVIYGISEGTYEMQTDAEAVPVIYFDMSEEPTRFVMAGDRRLSFAYRGTVQLKNGYACLHIENGGQTWVFEVMDNDTIAFAESKSDECKLAKDGDVFVYQAD